MDTQVVKRLWGFIEVVVSMKRAIDWFQVHEPVPIELNHALERKSKQETAKQRQNTGYACGRTLCCECGGAPECQFAHSARAGRRNEQVDGCERCVARVAWLLTCTCVRAAKQRQGGEAPVPLVTRSECTSVGVA